MLRRFSLFLLPLLLVGGAAAAQTTPQTLSFNGDWSITQSVDPLPVGGQVQVAYDASRLPDCRGDLNGHPGWSITGYYSLNGGPVGSFEAGGYSPSGGTQQPIINLPEQGDLAIWFQVTNAWGCSAWDSNYGNNYHFNVGNPTIAFNADWSEVVKGTLKAGKTFIVNYDLSRLPTCRQTYNGLPTWEIVVEYRFDGGAVTSTPVTTTNGGYTRVSAPTPITAPAGAHQVEMWFKNTDRTSCVQYDSDYGQNYRFNLQ